MALPQDETTTEQPSIDYEALGLEPVSDEELFGFGLQTEEPETPKAETPEIDYEALGLEPVGDKELFGFEMPKEEIQPSESFLRPVADPFLNIGAGVNDVVKGFTDAFGADNAVSQNLAKNSEWYRSLLSAGAKQDQEEIGRIMQEAEGQGVLAEIGAGLKALSVAPVDLVAQGIGSLIPFIATAGVGKAVGLSKGGIAILQGVQGGVVGGGIVKGEIYSAVKDQLINSGVDEAKAEKAAQEAQAYNGKNLDQIFLGVGLGVAASTTGADSAIRSLIARKVGKETAEQVSEQAIQEVLRTGFVRGAVKDGAVEFATEALQGGQERLAANIAVGREGFDVEPMRGVVGQAVLEGALGGILGGAAGGISAKVEQMDARQKVALRDAQKAAEEAKQSNAPASAAAVEEQVNQTIEETPDEKVARLQREAQEGVGEIELEEEVPVSGLPPIETYEQVQAKQRDAQEKFRQYAEEQRVRGATKEQINEARQKQLQPVLDKIESDWRSATETAATEWADSVDPFNLPQLPENLRMAEARIFGEKLLQRLAKNLGVTEDNTVTLNATTPDGRSGTVRISMSGDGEVRAVSQFGEGASRSEGFGFLDFVTEGFNAQTGETTLSRVEPIKLQQPVTPPVTPTPEAAVAPIEPVVTTEGAVEPTAAAAPTEPAAAEPVPAVAPRPAVDVEALSPNAKRANRILTNTGIDPETAAFVAQQYQDEIADLGGEELRAFVLDKFEENGGVIPAQMRYSEDQEYYEMAFGIGPEEAATLVENAKGQNTQMAQAELEQNKQWRRKDEQQQITETQQGVAVAQPEAQAVPVPTGEVPPSPAIEGRGVPAATQAKVAQPTLPSTPRFAPLPEPRAYSILRQAREERRNAPRNRRSSLEPKETIGKTARQVLREAARMNLTPIIEFDKNDFRMQDVAAVLAEANLPDLDTEKVVSLSSLGRRGRAVRTYGRKIGVPSTQPTTMATLVHEVGHTLTASQIQKYSNRIRGKGGRAYIDGLRKAINDKATPEPIARIFSLYISTLDQLGIMNQYGKSGGLAGTRHPDMSRNRARKLQEAGTLRNDLNSSVLYGLANVDEFVAQTFSSNSMRDLLKTIKAPESNRSIWSEFVSAIKSILNLPDDTMAAAVIQAAFDISEQVPTGMTRATPTPAPQPEARESRRAAPIEIQQQYAPKTDEEQQSFDRASTNKILARSPQLAVAAVRMKNGEITAGEYADLVDILDPFVVKGADSVPTNEKIYQYMSQTAGGKPTSEEGKKKLAKIGALKEDGTQRIPNGKLAEFRIDIPTYNESTKNGDTVYSITGHEPVSETAKSVGETIAHLGIAKITNPQFITRTISGKGDAVQIAMGAGKFPLATVKGNYEAITELPSDINDPNAWTEAGYNPVRSSELVDVRSKQAVVGGTEAIMVGSRVFVKNAQLEARPTGVTMGERYARRTTQPTVGMTTDAVRARLEALGFGVEGMIRIVEDPQAAFEGRTIIQDGKAVRIELNASALNDDAAIDRVLNHEFAEAANADGTLNKLVERLTPKEKKEINDAITRLGYEERVRTTEEAARAIETLAAGWKGRGFFERAVARVEAWGSKLGLKLTRRAAEYIAARNLTEVNENVRKWHISDALANLNGARRVDFNGVQAVLIPPSQMREAYSIAAYHGTPHEIKGRFQLAKIGTGEGATVYGWGLYFAENIDVALEYKNRLAKELRYAGSEFDNKNPSHVAADRLAMGKFYGKSREEVIQELENDVDYYADNENAQAQQWSQQIVQILRDNNEAKIERVGNLYSVDLDVSKDQLMDWDKPLSEQNPEVRKKLEPLLPPALQKPFEKKTIQELIDEDPTIQYVYRYLVAQEMNKTSFLDMFRTLSEDEREFRAKQKVSEAFRNSGIIGIRYLDQGSRFAQPKKTGFGWLVDDYRGSNYFKTKEEAIAFAEEAQTRNYVIFDEDVISITGRNGQPVDIRESRREPAPTFTEESPEAKTLSNLKASMEKVDGASETKGGKPETQKVSEIAANWMEQGGDERALQDAITENTNLSPVNAAKVAKVIAKQYDKQQQIAEAILETETGVTLEGLPEGMEIPKDVDPKNKRTVLQRVIDATTGVRVKPVILQVPEKTALKEQIRLKARETREAKKAQQETADAVVEAIKALELRGPMRAKQAQALAKRAAKVIWTSEKSMENFIAYAERVMANTNYDADLREAKAAQKRAKELSKRDSIAAPQRFVLEAIGNVGINLLNDPREFADVVNHYLRSFKPVVSDAYVVVPDPEMESYLSMAEDEVVSAKAEFEVEDNEKLAEKYGVSVKDLQRFLDAEDIMDALEGYAKREVIEGILNEKSSNVKEALKGVDTTILRADQRKLIDAMKVIDVKSLDSAEKQAYVRIGNNIIFNNNQTNGAEFFVATAKGQQAARDLAKNTEAMTKNKAWANILPSLGSRKAKKLLKSWASELQSIADTFRNAFGKEAMTVFYEAMGMVDLDLGFTQAARTLEEIQEKMAKFYDKLGKKYKGAATNQDGILSEGIVGYLIQNVPAKGEADSLAQRRGLMQQGITNLRKSGDEDKIQMADRIQQLMQRLDGDTVDQMLSNLKREYPANYESLMWLKDDLFPQYKDFLKFSDENFNDQANNYNTPNYLPIVYSNASPALDLLQGKKKYYDNLSSSPKQSSYTIKRSDYTQLPMGSDGRTPKEIGLNLRKNAYNSLSDQITRAYTNPARQRISSFLKTPEAEEALGGKANLDFFADRIERLMGSRERRGSFNEGFFGKAVDVLANLVRDIGTRIALAGSYQLIRQPADQVTVAVGATGRADLMAEHLAPRSIQTARPVLDLFSVGRRGDASSGYKYINQMEGAQSRLERYYTEGNWVKAKEAAKRFSDKFMTPLKVSDFTVAAATWMTFYRAYLAKNGIKFTTWEDAANLIKSDDVGHKRAAAYAENMTDIYQGSSDPTKMAVFAQKGKTGTENLLKSILVPFNSFGIQFRARVSSDITEIFTKSGDWKGKAIAVKDLSATIGGTVMFGLAKRFVLPAITYGGIKILYGIFGVDVEEPDEEKQKEEFDQKWRQLQGDIISTMAVGGFGQMIEGHTIDGMNYIKYMIDTVNESESVLDDDGEIMSFNKYSKERAPFYRYRSFDNAPSLGMLDIGMDQARKAILNTKMVLTPEEMERFTPEEQRFLLVGLISDWLYLGGFNDADFARMWEKGRRDMIKARKEEEKELQRIRSGR